jgi:hypothetical protein
LTSPRFNHTVITLLDGRVAIIGGNEEGVLADIEIFDPNSQKFTIAGGVLTSSRHSHSAALTDTGEVALIGGGTASIDTYDPVTDKVQVRNANPYQDSALHIKSKALNIGNHTILVYGGYTANRFYNPVLIDTETWVSTEMNTVSQHRIDFAILRLKNGKVLISGGWNSEGVKSDIVQFDPVDTSFVTLALNLTSPRKNHTMVEYPNGKVGVYGGYDVNGVPQKTVEELDLSALTSTTKGNLIDSRANMQSVCLPNGYTLHVGGTNLNNYATNALMVYDPDTMSSGYTGSIMGLSANLAVTEIPKGLLLVTGDYTEILDPQSSIFITYHTTWVPTSEEIQFTANGATAGLVWSCDVGTIDQTGLYHTPNMPVADVAYITATNNAGQKAIAHINFLKAVVNITGPTLTSFNTPAQFSASVAYYRTIQTVTWSIDDSTKGSIDATGLFTPAQGFTGTVRIKGTCDANPVHSSTFDLIVDLAG